MSKEYTVKRLIVLILFIYSFSLVAFANKSAFEAELINNPVKETNAKFKFTLPPGFEIDKAKIVIKSGKVKYKFKTEDIAIKKVGSDTFGEIAVSNLAPGKYEVKIKVKDKRNKDEHDCNFKTKGTLKDFVEMTIDASLEVADPGQEGKNTLAGIDTDNSGVRDDVQRWINESYNDKINMKKALKQMSKSQQNEILNADNQQQALLHIHTSLRAASCLVRRQIEAELIYKEIYKDLSKVVYNTLDRLTAYAKNRIHAKDIDTGIATKKDTAVVCD